MRTLNKCAEDKKEYLHVLACMSVVRHSQAISDIDLLTSVKELLQNKCKKGGIRHQVPDDEGDVIVYVYHWRGATVSADAQRRVFGVMKFKNEDAKESLVRYACTENQKRHRTYMHKKRTLVRKKERHQKQIDREWSAVEES
jgi:hypothetical protein